MVNKRIFFLRCILCFTLLDTIACNTNTSISINTSNSKIFPLSPYMHEDAVLVENKGELPLRKKACVRIFILENDIPDTGYLKKRLLSFIDSSKEEQSILKSYYQCRYWFYKTSEKLNKNYVEDPKRNPLGTYVDDYIADVTYTNGTIETFFFCKKGIILRYK